MISFPLKLHLLLPHFELNQHEHTHTIDDENNNMNVLIGE